MERSEDVSAFPLRRADVETYVLPDGSCVLFDPHLGEGFTLNASGALIWEYCDAALATEEVAREVASLLPNEPHAHTDGLAVIAQLLEDGLLEMQSERATVAASDASEN
jgi:Coenzyme PQQ synthesis protein D (PqqD)